MGSREEVGSRTHCGHSCCNANFQILLTSDFHRLGDDANENHNYIACLLILWSAYSDSSFNYRSCFLELKLKVNSDVVPISSSSELLVYLLQN